MEGIIFNLFATVGAVSLYLVIATIVSMGIYSSCKNTYRSDRIALAVIGGFLFPISIPVIILIYWIYAIVSIPFDQKFEDENETKKVVSKSQEKDIKPLFKVGDVITGVPGNPGRYKCLYEGCSCRVLTIDNKDDMEVILIDHQDKEAHLDRIGERFEDADPKYFKLVKSTTSKKK